MIEEIELSCVRLARDLGVPLDWVLRQDWLTFDALLARSTEVVIEDKIERLIDGSLAAQGQSKDIKKRVRQLEGARKRQRSSNEPDKKKRKAQPNRKGLRDFLDAVRGSKRKEDGGGGR